jgi:ATP-dependent Clp protease ATP-binding subunit ClpA
VFERFTDRARQGVMLAQAEARQLGHNYIGTEHLLLGVLDVAEGPAATVLADRGITDEWVRGEIVRIVGRGGETPPSGADAEALRRIGIDLEAIRASVEATFGPGALDVPVPPPRKRRRRLLRRAPRCTTPAVGRIPFTPRAKKVLELSLREAVALSHRHIDNGHVLLGLVREGRGLATEILRERTDLDDLRRKVLDQMGRAA